MTSELERRWAAARKRAQELASKPGHRVRVTAGTFKVEKFDGKHWVTVAEVVV